MRENDDALDKTLQAGQDIDASRSRSDGDQSVVETTDARLAIPTEMMKMTPGDTGHPDDERHLYGLGTRGNQPANAFTGSLQGAGYDHPQSLHKHKHNNCTTRVGLFGQTGSASVIQNVGVTDAYIKSIQLPPVSAGWWGRMMEVISNSYATGSVTGSGPTFCRRAGGG